MNIIIFRVIFKISALTFLFFLIIFGVSAFLKDDSTSNLNLEKKLSPTTLTEAISNNKSNFKTSAIPVLGPTGVAISTNIGIRYNQMQQLPVTIYKDVMDISYIIANKETANDSLISSNMIFLREYLNVLKTDVKALIGKSSDRGLSLDSYISQLEYRYRTSFENLKTLSMQRDYLVTTVKGIDDKIKDLKNKMSGDFSNFDSTATKKNIDDYLKLKEESIYATTYIVFIDKYIGYYKALDNYNKKVLDALINNKEAIIKSAYLVIPDTGTDVLKDLNLLYDEKTFKEGGN